MAKARDILTTVDVCELHQTVFGISTAAMSVTPGV